jgi:hypothetical protein
VNTNGCSPSSKETLVDNPHSAVDVVIKSAVTKYGDLLIVGNMVDGPGTLDVEAINERRVFFFHTKALDVVATRGDTKSDEAHSIILPRVLCLAAIENRDSYVGGGGLQELWANDGECLDRVDQRRYIGCIDLIGVNFGRFRIRTRKRRP